MASVSTSRPRPSPAQPPPSMHSSATAALDLLRQRLARTVHAPALVDAEVSSVVRGLSITTTAKQITAAASAIRWCPVDHRRSPGVPAVRMQQLRLPAFGGRLAVTPGRVFAADGRAGPADRAAGPQRARTGPRWPVRWNIEPARTGSMEHRSGSPAASGPGRAGGGEVTGAAGARRSGEAATGPDPARPSPFHDLRDALLATTPGYTATRTDRGSSAGRIAVAGGVGVGGGLGEQGGDDLGQGGLVPAGIAGNVRAVDPAFQDGDGVAPDAEHPPGHR